MTREIRRFALVGPRHQRGATGGLTSAARRFSMFDPPSTRNKSACSPALRLESIPAPPPHWRFYWFSASGTMVISMRTTVTILSALGLACAVNLSGSRTPVAAQNEKPAAPQKTERQRAANESQAATSGAAIVDFYGYQDCIRLE